MGRAIPIWQDFPTVQILRVLLILASAIHLSGCLAGTPEQELDETNPAYRELYDGKSRVAFGTEFPANSPLESVLRGDDALRGGDFDRALFEYVTALELGDKTAETPYKVGRIHSQRGNRRLASVGYVMALQRESKHAGALEGLGLLQLEERNYDAAKVYLVRAVETDQRRWEAHNALGVIADLENDYDAAQGHYHAALAMRPGSAQLLNNLGYSRYLAGQWEEAMVHLGKSVNKDRSYEKAWMNLGLIHTRRGNYAEALHAYRQVMEPPEALNNVGYVASLDGNYKIAESYLRQAIDLSPKYYPAANDNLRRVLAQSQI